MCNGQLDAVATLRQIVPKHAHTVRPKRAVPTNALQSRLEVGEETAIGVRAGAVPSPEHGVIGPPIAGERTNKRLIPESNREKRVVWDVPNGYPVAATAVGRVPRVERKPVNRMLRRPAFDPRVLLDALESNPQHPLARGSSRQPEILRRPMLLRIKRIATSPRFRARAFSAREREKQNKHHETQLGVFEHIRVERGQYGPHSLQRNLLTRFTDDSR
eukprot:5445047-Prymnesium_polylepis.1